MSDIRSTTARAAAPPGVTAGGGARPGVALLVLATAQLMVVLDSINLRANTGCSLCEWSTTSS